MMLFSSCLVRYDAGRSSAAHASLLRKQLDGQLLRSICRRVTRLLDAENVLSNVEVVPTKTFSSCDMLYEHGKVEVVLSTRNHRVSEEGSKLWMKQSTCEV